MTCRAFKYTEVQKLINVTQRLYLLIALKKSETELIFLEKCYQNYHEKHFPALITPTTNTNTTQ
jgi:hypothetical protein